jgi:hypothetical protein
VYIKGVDLLWEVDTKALLFALAVVLAAGTAKLEEPTFKPTRFQSA